MSDVGLAKICRKHDIPVPPVGYWRRKETGYKVARPPLHPPKNGPETLDIYVRERLKPDLVVSSDGCSARECWMCKTQCLSTV